jgi:multicomponent Na+:H+ antiporter subunit F
MIDAAIIELVLTWTAAALLAAGAVTAVVRIVRGPSVMDRMIASDVLLTTLVLAIGAEMVINQHTDTVLVMIAITAVAAFATVAVARNVSKQDRTAEAPLPPQSTEVSTMTAPTSSAARKGRRS